MNRQQVSKATLPELLQFLSEERKAVARRFPAFEIPQTLLGELNAEVENFEQHGNEAPLKEAIGRFCYHLQRKQEGFFRGCLKYFDQKFVMMQQQLRTDDAIDKIDDDLVSRWAKHVRAIELIMAPKRFFNLDDAGVAYHRATELLQEISSEQRARVKNRRERVATEERRRRERQTEEQALLAQQQRQAELSRRQGLAKSVRIAAGLAECEPATAESILPIFHSPASTQ